MIIILSIWFFGKVMNNQSQRAEIIELHSRRKSYLWNCSSARNCQGNCFSNNLWFPWVRGPRRPPTIRVTNHGRHSSESQYHPEQNSSESKAVNEKIGTEHGYPWEKCSKYFQKEAQVILLQGAESAFAHRKNSTGQTKKSEKPEVPIRSWSSSNNTFFRRESFHNWRSLQQTERVGFGSRYLSCKCRRTICR